jgi:integrase/recombinase XerD
MDTLAVMTDIRQGEVVPGILSDSEAAAAWLSLYTLHTLRAYQRELGAFQHFIEANGIQGLRLVSMAHARDYLSSLSDTKHDYAKRVLNSFYQWLLEAGYVHANPIAACSEKRLQRKPRAEKSLRQGDIAYLITAIHELEGKLRNYATRRWIFWLLFHTGARREEIAGNTLKKDLQRYSGQRLPSGQRGPMVMSNFSRRPVPTKLDAREGWDLRIVGKGDKERIVPASSALMRELERYRRHLRLQEALPRPLDHHPVVMGDDGCALSPQGIYANLKAITSAMADLLQNNPECERLVEDLRKVTPHWLRHTYVTTLVATGTNMQPVCKGSVTIKREPI